MEKVYLLKVNKRIIVIQMLMAILLVSELLSDTVSLLKYTDEIITVCGVIYICFYMKKINTSNLKLIASVSVCVVIGVISNILSGMLKSPFFIILDIISCFKIFIVFIWMDTVLTPNRVRIIAKSMNFIAKIFLVVVAICAILNFIIDIGMSKEERFGFREFVFIYEHAHLLAMSTFAMLAFILLARKTKQIAQVIYILLAMIILGASLKGPAIIWAVLFWPLYFLIRANRMHKLKKWHFIIIGIAAIILGYYQISTYFMNSNAPRFLFYKYGLVTAQKYFPIGAGFGTFGSNIAAEQYSPLYIKYGFEGLFGMSATDTSFLNDNYYPMLLGQIGIIGTIIVIFMLINIFKRVNTMKKEPLLNKVYAITIIIYLVIHSLGSALLTTSTGVLAAIILALLINANSENREGGLD